MNLKNGIKICSIITVILAVLPLFSCRQASSSSRVKIEKIQFAESKKTMEVGQRASLGITITPKEARQGAVVEYSASVPGIIAVDPSNSGSEGAVFTAVAPGSAVLLARSDGAVDYCDITVTGDSEIPIPYISLTESVLEIPVGKKKHVAASLHGGSPADQNNFGFSNGNDYYVYMESANNTAVLEGLRTGVSRVTVTHPKAQYSVDLVAFVLNEGETARYITGENVVFMEMGGGTREYSAKLVGVDESHCNNTIYQVVEGTGVLTVKGAGPSCTLEAKTAGAAKVRVSNQAVEYPFEFQVVVRQASDAKYIKSDSNFYIIDDNDTINFNVSMEGGVPFDWADRFTYSLDDTGREILEVGHVQDHFTVKGLKNGNAVLSVNNEYSDFPCEILFAVQNQKKLVDHGLYIRTSQNVIQMEAGRDAPDAILKMELVGGTSADQNLFEWVVEDSSIIEVKAPGTVRYTRAQINTQSSFEAEAVITAKKAGATRITVYNSKALYEVTVMVKVYPYGTFKGQAVYLGGPAVIRVKAGEEKEIYTPVIGGDPRMLGITVWESGDPSIADVSGSGLHGVVRGIENCSGVTRLAVSGENIAQAYESVVVVYREGEENTIPFIYTDNLHYHITVGQTVRIPVRHPNIAAADFGFTVNNTNKESIYYVLSGDVIIVNGFAEGCGELIITAADERCNNLKLYITVENEKPDIDRPYTLTGVNFIGTDEGGVVSYTANMTGASPAEMKNLIWSIDDKNVAVIKGISGGTVLIEGLQTGQTALKINHSKSVNEKTVVIYVVKKGEAAADRIVIGIEKANHVLLVNQSVFLRLLTNADDNDRKLFKYRVLNSENIHVDFNYDTMVVTGRKEGNSKITVSCFETLETERKNLIDLDIYITVKNELGIKAEIGFPDSIVLVKNQFKTVKGNAVGVSANSLNDIHYEFEDPSIAGLTGNGLEVTMKGLQAGQTFMAVSCTQLSFFRKVLVICVENENDLYNLYYCTVPQTLYRIKKGDEIKVSLGFGENGAPPDGVYEWKNSVNNDAVTISVCGTGAVITGKNEGQAVIQITCNATPRNKPVEIIVEVSGNVNGSDFYRFGFMAGVRQMSNGSVEMIPVSIYYGNEYYDDYDVLNPGIRLEQGYSGITVTVSDKSVLDAAMAGENGQSLRVSAKQAGRSEITISHNMIAQDAKLLVIVYEGDIPPEGSDFIFYVPQRHFLIDKGETRHIAVQTGGDPQAAQNALLWINHNPELFTLDSNNRIDVKVTALKEGSGRLTVQDAGGRLETVYVSVSDGNKTGNVSVATESIIVLSLEGAASGCYTTRIIVSGGSQNGITWYAGDYNLIDITGNGVSCVLYPKQCGTTELTVSGYGFSRTILVKITGTDNEKQQARLMNLDQRHFRMKKGETVILNPYYKLIRPSSAAKARLEYDNKVVQWETSGGGIAVAAKNIGIERLVLSNSECENEVSVVFEVDETVTGSVGEARNLVYMTTDNPVIILEPGYNDYYAGINVIGEYSGGEKDFIWSCDSAKIKLNVFGRYAFISAGKGEYKAVITVKNEYCVEPLVINVIVGSKYAQQEQSGPYMYTANNVYTMNKSDSSLLIPVEIRNVGTVNYNEISVSCTGSAVDCAFANGNIIVNARDIGTGMIEARYRELQLKLYVIVQEVSDNGAVFLTTVQNYIIVNENNTRAVTVDLVNYEEPDSAKITWKSGNTAVAHVIGSGKAVQVLGIGAGITKITASHDKSYNKLEIIVKVLPAGSSEDVCYLTTNENVIEMYTTSNNRKIQINKVGGKTKSVDASWSVDNTAVAGVMGTNDTAYITAKKAGLAKITVADREAGSLEIVIIVREAKPGDLHIIPVENIVQITPNSTNGVLSVTMDGIDESEEKNFKWEIYSQMPSDINVARNGGGVVGLYAMGRRATVNGIYAGTARIKVTHPKAAEAAFIAVQVANFRTMRFGQDSVDIVKNDMAYITLETPDYENYADKIIVKSDNPGVATVIGTHRVALISAVDTGKAVITAHIPDTGLTASVTVTVLEKAKYNEPEIITNQTMFVLSPREAPFYVYADIIGFGMEENDSESLVWKLNYTNEQKDSPIIKIYPENTGDKGFKSVGRSILVEVQHIAGKIYTNVEYCTLTISHPGTSRERVLYFQVQEESNAFTISKKSIQLETGQTAELSCNILNGSSKDYEEVVWEARRDDIDPGKDIVRIMGRGKTVQLLGMTDGYTAITASYRGLNTQGTVCTVTVKSVYYFNITYQNLLVYPGQKDKDGKGAYYINYSVRPPNAPVQWLHTDTVSDNKMAVISFDQAEDKDGDGTGEGRIYFDFLKEGNITILGTSNSKISRVDITIRNTFAFQILSHQSNDETPYLYNDGKLPPGASSYPNGVNPDGSSVKDKGYEIPYKVTPATASIKIKGTPDQAALFASGWEITIEPPRSEGLSGYGSIFIKNKVEEQRQITFTLLKPDGEPVSRGDEYDRKVTFKSRLQSGQARLVPVFERVAGGNSNSYGKNLSNKYSKNPPTGYPVSPNPSVSTGEYLKMENIQSVFSNGGIINDTYYLDIFDGEEHYILLDKYNPNAKITINPAYSMMLADTIGNGRGVSTSIVTLENGMNAVKISGGKDFTVYNRFGSYYDLTCDLSSDQSNYNGFDIETYIEKGNCAKATSLSTVVYGQSGTTAYIPTGSKIPKLQVETDRTDWFNVNNSQRSPRSDIVYDIFNTLIYSDIMGYEEGQGRNWIFTFWDGIKEKTRDESLWHYERDQLDIKFKENAFKGYLYRVEKDDLIKSKNGTIDSFAHISGVNWNWSSYFSYGKNGLLTNVQYELYKKIDIIGKVDCYDYALDGTVVTVYKNDDTWVGTYNVLAAYPYFIPAGSWVSDRTGEMRQITRNSLSSSSVKLYDRETGHNFGTVAQTRWNLFDNSFTSLDSDSSKPVIKIRDGQITGINSEKTFLFPYCNDLEGWKPYPDNGKSSYECYYFYEDNNQNMILKNFISGEEVKWSKGENPLLDNYARFSDLNPVFYSHEGGKTYVKIEPGVYRLRSDGRYYNFSNQALLLTPLGTMNKKSNCYVSLVNLDNEHYFPIASSSAAVVREESHTITISYTTERHDDNKVIINVRHKIRPDTALASGNKKWAETCEYNYEEFVNKDWGNLQLTDYEKAKGKIRLNNGY